jgi:hypothetical protein
MSSSARRHSREYRGHLCEPMDGLHDWHAPAGDVCHEVRGPQGMLFAVRVKEKPLDDDAGIQDDSHGRPASRAFRISPPVIEGRRLRRSVSRRNATCR